MAAEDHVAEAKPLALSASVDHLNLDFHSLEVVSCVSS